MGNDALAQKLKKLFALATLRASEEGDAGRANEARNAAFLLLKTARENGVKVLFDFGGVGAGMPDEGTFSTAPSGPKRYKAPVVVNYTDPRVKANKYGQRTCFCGKSLETRIWVGVDGCTHVGG
jgi:hypothetical protein